MKTEQQTKQEKQNEKVFDMYNLQDVRVEDPALKKYINLDFRLVLKTYGRNKDKFGKAKVNIIERLANLIAVAGHRGKKHKLIKGNATGKYSKNMKTVFKAFELIERKTKQNPVQILVHAIENAAPRDEITVIEYGGARYPQAVDVSPLRRLNLTMRNIVHGASDRAFNKKKSIAEGLAEEILLAFDGNMESFAMKKKNESEKQADSAR